MGRDKKAMMKIISYILQKRLENRICKTVDGVWILSDKRKNTDREIAKCTTSFLVRRRM